MIFDDGMNFDDRLAENEAVRENLQEERAATAALRATVTRLCAQVAQLRDALTVSLVEMLDMNIDLRSIGKGRHDNAAHPDCAIEQARKVLNIHNFS